MRANWVMAAAILAGALALLIAGGVSATQSGKTYSGSGNWAVDQPTTVMDETVDVSGNIVVSSTFDLTNVTLRFTVNGSTLSVIAPVGGLTLQPGSGVAVITTNDPNYYFSFTIANTTSNVNIQNATIDHVLNGVTVTGGLQTARYFANVKVTHANQFGFRLTDSFATLFKVNVSLDYLPVVKRVDWSPLVYISTGSPPGATSCTNSSTNYTTYGLTYTYHCIQETWSATGTGVSVLRGGPWFDGIEVHIPSLNQRLDFNLEGGFSAYYNYTWYQGYPSVCSQSGQQPNMYWYYYNYTYHSILPFLSYNGTIAQDSTFGLFKDVRPPSEGIYLDVHYNMINTYTYTYEYCGYSPTVTYNYPYNVYSYNRIYWPTADVIGVKVTNGKIGDNFNNLNLSMGKTGITITCDWNQPAVYIGYFTASYGTFPTVNAYAFWSNETYTPSTAALTTRTDFTIRNSVVTGAGMRFDRYWTYTTPSQAGGAADTTFRGLVTVDNVSATNMAGLALEIRVVSLATATSNKFDYSVNVVNSLFDSSRAVLVMIPNQKAITSNYTANVLFEKDTFRNANVTPPASIPTTSSGIDGENIANTYIGAISVNTGWHPSTLAGDWYKVDVVLRNNTFTNMSGTLLAWGYSDFLFPGAATLTFQDNVFRNITYWTAPVVGGGMTPPMQGGEMIKAPVDTATFLRNTFDQVAVTFGIIGGWVGPNPAYPYYPFSICAYYVANYAYAYWYYGCSWPSKTPTIIVESNSFNGVTTPSGAPRDSAFFALPGHAHVLFNNNTITNSNSVFVNAFLYFYSSSYRFPVEDIDVTILGNTIVNQRVNAPFLYEDPYKGGQPMRVINNVMRDSQTALVTWMWGYYAAMSSSYRPTENLATMIVTGNTIRNSTLQSDAAIHVTGRATVQNNTIENVVGWAVVIDFMSKVPLFGDTNTIRNVTNGYWIAPINTGGGQTVSLSNITIPASGTSIRMENANLLLLHMEFGGATTPVMMVNGHADIYSSNLGVLSASVSGGGSVSVYNEIGFSVRWGNALGTDSGVPVANAALMTSSAQHKILGSARADAQGLVPKKMVLIWEKFSFGSVTSATVYAPFEILISSSGISQTVLLPTLGPGEVPTTFQDYPQYPVLLLDTLIPTISIGSPVSGATLGYREILVEGHSFERGSGLAAQRLRVDAGDWIDVTQEGSATWQISISGLSEGTHVLVGEVRDRAGNDYTTQVSFIVDLTAPWMTLTRPMQEITFTNEPLYVVQGHVDPADSAIDVNGIRVFAEGGGDFSFEYALQDGLNVLFITAEDIAGNQVTIVRSITFDRYSPFIQVTAPIDGLKTNVKTISVVGRAEPGSTVTVNGAPVAVDPQTGAFILPNLVLEDLFDQTENLLVIRAQDDAGNTAFDNRTLTVDTRAPEITLELDASVASRIAAGLPVSASSVDVKGKTDSSDALVQVGGQDVPLTGLSFSRVMVLAEGSNSVEIKAMDTVGNIRTITLHIVRDTAPPTLTIDRPESLVVLTNERTMEIRGSTNAQGATVFLTYTNAAGATIVDAIPAVPVGLPISYRFERLIDLVPDGNVHAVTVRVVDLAGNEASQVVSYTSKVAPPFVELDPMPTSVTQTFVWVNGSTDEGITKVRINGQEFPVIARAFSVRWNLPVTSGDYTFRVSVVDAAGNVGSTESTVKVTLPQQARTTAGTGGVSGELLAGAALAVLGVSVAVLILGWSRRKQSM
jgi:hypothetical protein